VSGGVLERLSVRTPLVAADSLSGAELERARLDGRPVVVKHLRLGDDWVARATGDLRCRPLTLWTSGLLRSLPDCIDHAIVHAERLPGDEAVLVLEDVSDCLIPEGSAALPLAQHRRFLDHMAALHVRFWGFPDDGSLLELGNRYLAFAPFVAEAERAWGGTHPIPTREIPKGWRALARVDPDAWRTASRLFADPAPLLHALEDTPTTFVHGDWKAGNLGSRADGRTILLDWALSGPAPACADLGWYLAVNCDRLPEPKEAAIAAYRRGLEDRGVRADGWFERQLELCLIGAFLQLGWSKAVGEPGELRWWTDRVAAGSRSL
jgi:hypothetical protein